MLLAEFNIAYVSQSSIKGQALADQIAERTVDDVKSKEPVQFPMEMS